MDLRYLKLVKTIEEEGSISKSAGRLFLTQSALSHQLRDFEERMGVKIFTRSRNDWKLTQEGKEIYALACDVLGRIEEGMKKVKEVQTGARGSIKLSTECYSFYHGLPRFIQKMNLLYPEIELKLKIESKQRPVSQLLSYEVDVCLLTTRPHHEKIISYELFQDELFALMHVEHELSERDYLEPADFATQHLIIHSLPLETVSVYQHFLKPHQVEPTNLTAIPMTEVVLELVQANMGIACYPKWALTSFKSLAPLKFVPLGEEGLKRKHVLSIRAEDQDKKYIQDFIENIQEENLLRV